MITWTLPIMWIAKFYRLNIIQNSICIVFLFFLITARGSVTVQRRGWGSDQFLQRWPEACNGGAQIPFCTCRLGDRPLSLDFLAAKDALYSERTLKFLNGGWVQHASCVWYTYQHLATTRLGHLMSYFPWLKINKFRARWELFISSQFDGVSESKIWKKPLRKSR